MLFVRERGASWGFPVLFGNGPSSPAVNLLLLFRGSRESPWGGIPAGLLVQGLRLPSPCREVCLQHSHPVPHGSISWRVPWPRAQPRDRCPEPGCRVWPGGCGSGSLPGLGGTLCASECKFIQDYKKAREGERSAPAEQESFPHPLGVAVIPLGTEPAQGCPWG